MLEDIRAVVAAAKGANCAPARPAVTPQRKLTVILAADAAGYSRVMDEDEVRGYRALKAGLRIFETTIRRRHGRIANTAGDGLIAEFASEIEAIECAVEVQRRLQTGCARLASTLRFRIGIHVGEVILNGNDLLGRDINLAARLQSMAEPGQILASQQMFDKVKDRDIVRLDYVGMKRPKNFLNDVAVYSVLPSPTEDPGVQDPRASSAFVPALEPADRQDSCCPSPASPSAQEMTTSTVSALVPSFVLKIFGRLARSKADPRPAEMSCCC